MFLAIDLGTTNFKAAIFNPAMERLATASHQLTYLSRETKYELAVEEVDKALEQVIKGAIDAAGIKNSDIKAVGITSQAQTVTVMDKNGNCKIPFISWLDVRAVETVEKMKQEPLFADIAEHSTFWQLLSGMMLCIIKNQMLHDPNLIIATDQLVPLPSYAIRSLTGRNITDANLSAMSTFYSLKYNDWWHDAIEYCGLKVDQLPELCHEGVPTVELAERYGLPENIPVFSSGNDQTAGAYGAQVHKSDSVLITLGSAQVAYACYPEMPPPSTNIARGPYPGGRFYRMAVDSYGGSLISMIIEKMSEFSDFDSFFQLAAEADGTNSCLKLNLDKKTNEISWDGHPEHPGEYALTVIDFISSNMAELVHRLKPDLSGTEIYCAGGGTKNRIWTEALEKKLAKKLTIIEADPLLGAARMIQNKK